MIHGSTSFIVKANDFVPTIFLLLLPDNPTSFKNEDSCGGRSTKHWKYKVHCTKRYMVEVIWSTIWQAIALKIILLRKNKISNAFKGIQNDEVKKEITCAMISVPLISWFTCAVVRSFGVITNRIRTAIVGPFFALVDVWNHIDNRNIQTYFAFLCFRLSPVKSREEVARR